MRVGLITEGTYPFAEGGVSVWCDQLVRGMPAHRFHLHALVATGCESRAWGLPSNVDRLVAVPLWGALPAGRGSRSLRRTFDPIFSRFLVAIGPTGSSAAMARSLQELHTVAQTGRLPAALRSGEVLEQLLVHMSRNLEAGRVVEGGVPAATVADAAQALLMLEHYLRPLAAPVPDVDLCHSAANGLGALVAMAGKWERGTPFILTEHGIYLRESLLAHGPGTMSHSTRQVVLAFIRRLTQGAYRMADVVSPGSDYNRRWEVAEGVDGRRLRRIHNGIDPEVFSDAVPEPREPVVAWVGRVNPLKDLKTLLRAFARIVAEVPEARLRIFGATPLGDEDYLAECQTLLAHLGLEGAATFEGRVDEAVDAYRAGQVVMLTSISEGFPYAVIEAMACGRATVATDVGGVPEAIADGGQLAPPRDDETLADACIALLKDPERRRVVAAEGRRRVVERFTLGHCIEAHATLYEDVLGARVGARPRAMTLAHGRPPRVRVKIGSRR